MQSPTLESYRRVRGAELSSRFYDALLASHPDIRRSFAKTDFARQHDLFQHGLLMLLEFAQGSSVGRMAMHRLGEMHGPGHLDVAPHLYEHWIRCLVETVAALDPRWSDELEREWREDLRRGIDLLADAYRRPAHV